DEVWNQLSELELPMSLEIVSGASRVYPMAVVAYKLLNIYSAKKLAQVAVAVNLEQNLGTLKALATDGIQKGHMVLHSRSVAMAAGATGEMVDMIAEKLIEMKEIRVGYAKKLMEEYAK